jgi:type II secretory pathway component GspD/PulD (secretin)
MLVEVTIILSDDTTVENRGVNLMDGLQMQFGFNDNKVEISGFPSTSLERTVTQTITIPTLTYNMNILNNQKQFYWVLGRPTLTAYLNEESTFFVGHTIHVVVAGINLGSLESVDAGVTLQLKPLEINGKHVKFHIDADRSFLDPVSVPGITQQFSLFKEQASATAELDYGQTLILSGMEESVYDGDKSITPGAADVPLLGELFGRSGVSTQRTSVLILVTPVPPVALELPHRLTREDTAEKVVDLWTSMIDPETDMGEITGRLKNWRNYTRAESGDLMVSGPADPQVRSQALGNSSGVAPY